MSRDIETRQTPEERELARKTLELAKLETELAQHELDIATLEAELRAFESRYLSIVGICYAELDDIEAEIAEAKLRLNPHNIKTKENASEARTRAQESAQATGEVQDQKRVIFKPSESLRKLYREIAKRIHPDLSTEQDERVRRQQLMADANRAYEEGNEDKLRVILYEWESSPETVAGEGTAAELVRVIRKLSQVQERLSAIETEIIQIKESNIYQLKIKTEEAESKGQDLLSELASHLDDQIAEARKRLKKINMKLAKHE